MRVEHAELSLKGARESNQDRVGAEVAERRGAAGRCRRHGRARGGRAGRDRSRSRPSSDRFRAATQPMLDPHRLPAPGARGRAPADRKHRRRHPGREPAAGDHRAVPGAAGLGLLGARGRQPRLPPAARQAHGAHARSQPRGAAGARGCHRRRSGAQSPDAQLRRILPRAASRCCRRWTLSRRQPLEKGDVLLVCTDGFWAGVERRGHRRGVRATAKQPLERGAGQRSGPRRWRRAARAATTPRPPRCVTWSSPCLPVATIARPMPCAPCASRATSRATPKARCWSSSATRACCAPPPSRTACRAFLRGKGQGWVTAEYGMLPRATHTRSAREAARGKQTGRTQEIQRLIGRSLRAVVDLRALGERTVTLDCDVLQADGGTRTAVDHRRLRGARRCGRDAACAAGCLAASPLHGQVAAVSVGIVGGQPVLDLDYGEDSEAETDMNVVMNNGGALHRGAGHGRGPRLPAPRVRRAAEPRGGGHRRAVRAAGAGADGLGRRVRRLA